MRIVGMLAIVALAACGKGTSGDDSGPATGAPTGSTTSTGGTNGGTPTGGGADRSAALTGSIATCAGADAPNDTEVKFCDIHNCRYYTVEAGVADFEFANTLVGWNSFEVTGPDGSGLATGFVPLEFAPNQSRDLSFTLCPADPATALTGTPTEMQLGEGLYVTLSTTSIAPPLFVDPATEAAGVRLPTTAWVPTDGIAGTVVEQWFVDPFNNAATGADLPVRFDGGTLGLAAASYRGYVGSYDDYSWLDLGTFSDGDADGWYTSDAGTGLPLLGTVLLVEE